jgi:hypothetical protein
MGLATTGGTPIISSRRPEAGEPRGRLEAGAPRASINPRSFFPSLENQHLERRKGDGQRFVGGGFQHGGLAIFGQQDRL